VAVLAEFSRGAAVRPWAIEAFPGLAEAEHVLLANDSIIGPLGDEEAVAALLARGEASGPGVFAATRGLVGSDHLQSFWLQFNGTFGHPAVTAFFADLPRTRDRADLNLRYEHALSETLRRSGLTLGWAWDASSWGLPPSYNPSLCWRELLDAGFPFVKRKLLGDHPRFRGVREEVRAHVRERYGVELT
jgi:hypothetical protein